MSTLLTPTEIFLFGLVTICLIVPFGLLINRVLAKYLNADFMTPQETANYHFKGQTPERV